MVLVVGRLAEDSAEEGAVGESEAGRVSDLKRKQLLLCWLEKRDTAVPGETLHRLSSSSPSLQWAERQ